MDAVYLGVADCAASGAGLDGLHHRFFVGGRVRRFLVAADGRYTLQNRLMEGYLYDIAVLDGVVTAAELLTDGERLVTGTVESVGDGSLTVSGRALTLPHAAGIYAIKTAAGGASVVRSTLAAGDGVRALVEGDTAKAVYKSFVPTAYAPPVRGVPGLRTLKNLLATALEAVGVGLYVYGGGWSWQDVGAANQAMTIGIPPSWVDFFQAQDAHYRYRATDAAPDYYPWGGWNRYYYAGADCAGYLGWVLYNVTHTVSGTVASGGGYVSPSTGLARSLSQRGWGRWSRDTAEGFRVGDVFSMAGHVWLCLGVCPDGSMVILHATPSNSRCGCPGGGIQLSALSTDASADCAAYALVEGCMAAHYPQWFARYPVAAYSRAAYTAIAGSECAGKFSWDLSGGGLLRDPDGYAKMTPAEILADLFPT